MGRWVIILFFICNLGFTQEVYKSSHSLHVPSGIVETIQRVITVREKKIIIESDAGNDLVDVQTLVIKSEELNFDDFTSFWVYQCTSEDGIYPSLVIIEEAPAYISVFQPNKVSGEDEEYRLFLEVHN